MKSKKIALLGMWGVGKTSLVRRYVESIYSEKYISTLGVKIDKKTVQHKSETVCLMLWDIAGAEENFTVPPHFIKGASAYLLVIDGTRKRSLEMAVEMIDYVNAEVGPIPFVAIVNKSDLNWEMDDSEIQTALEPYGSEWIKASAKSGDNVDLAFHMLAQKMFEPGT